MLAVYSTLYLNRQQASGNKLQEKLICSQLGSQFLTGEKRKPPAGISRLSRLAPRPAKLLTASSLFFIPANNTES